MLQAGNHEGAEVGFREEGEERDGTEGLVRRPVAGTERRGRFFRSGQARTARTVPLFRPEAA